MVHGNAAPGTTSPCTGLIDPRLESDDGVNLNMGIRQVTIVFNEPVRAIGGGSVAAGSYHNDCEDLLYFDIDRDGVMPEPQDLIRYRQMLEGSVPATQVWKTLQEMNAEQP